MTPEELRYDALWKSHAESHPYVRHYEDQRTALAGPIIAIAGALIGFATLDKSLSWLDIPVLVAVIIIGIFWAAFFYKQFQMAQLYRDRASNFRE